MSSNGETRDVDGIAAFLVGATGFALVGWFVVGYSWPWEAQVTVITVPWHELVVYLPLLGGLLSLFFANVRYESQWEDLLRSVASV